jgi:proline iminopeptidase
MTTTREVEWITEAMGLVFPREWEEFEAAAQRAPGQRLVDAYYELLTNVDPGVRADAARAWCAWEDTHVSLNPRYQHDTRYDDPLFRQVFATLVTHYWKHSGFGSDRLLDGMSTIAHIPAVLVHGRLDVSSPLGIPWKLHLARLSSELIVVEAEGHGGQTSAPRSSAPVRRLTRAPRPPL